MPSVFWMDSKVTVTFCSRNSTKGATKRKKTFSHKSAELKSGGLHISQESIDSICINGVRYLVCDVSTSDSDSIDPTDHSTLLSPLQLPIALKTISLVRTHTKTLTYTHSHWPYLLASAEVMAMSGGVRSGSVVGRGGTVTVSGSGLRSQ